MKHLIFILIVILGSIIINSCHKEETDEERFRKDLPGHYDWVSSYSPETNGETGSSLFVYKPSNQGINYGLSIKKNGKAFLYENGKQVKAGEVTNIAPQTSGSQYNAYTSYFVVTIKFGESSIEFSSQHTGNFNGMSNSAWPYPNFNNNFKAIPK